MNVDILQVAYDSGHRAIRMGAGPLRLLHSGLADHLADPDREVRVIPVETGPGFTAEVASAFELARKVRHSAALAGDEGRFPLLLAGNCVASLGVVAALGEPDVYWLDAHGDLNTPDTTTSGFLDGMALSILLGRCWRGMARGIGLVAVPERKVRLLGARDLDPGEADFLAAGDVVRIGPDDLDRIDGAAAPPGVAYLHVDLDALDPSVGNANEFAAPGGFSVAGILDVVDRVAEHATIGGAALTAFDPEADLDGAIGRAAFRIARHIVERAEAGSASMADRH